MQEKEQKISPSKQKISEFISSLGISKRDFYAKTGISRGTIENTTGITEDTLAKLFVTYPELSAEWVLRGEGDMLRVTQVMAEPVAKEVIELPLSNKELLDRIERLVEEKAELKCRIVELEKVKKQSQPITYGAAVEPIPQLEKGHRHK